MILAKYKKVLIVFNPVMITTREHRLIEEKTIEIIIEKLFLISNIITPNMDKAAILAKMEVKILDDIEIAGQRIKELGCKNILLKGRYLEEKNITSIFITIKTVIRLLNMKKLKLIISTF